MGCWALDLVPAYRLAGLEQPGAAVAVDGASQQMPTNSQLADGPPQTITLQDAIARAQRIYSPYLSTLADAKFAQEDRRQARNAMLPSVGYTQQYLGTQGNGRTPTGRFVTNDGVHVYRAWGVVHEDVPAGFFSAASYKRAAAGAALADAKAEIARRGLVVTVTKAFYTLLAAQRKYASAQQTVTQAQSFLNDTQKLQKGGEVAHADVIRAQIQFDQQKIALQETELAMNNAHLSLAVLLSPDFDQNFTAVDDMDHTPALPGLQEVKTLAGRQNQDLQVAFQALKEARADVTIARAGFLPTLSFDAVYGIEANAFALHSRAAGFPGEGPLPESWILRHGGSERADLELGYH